MSQYVAFYRYYQRLIAIKFITQGHTNAYKIYEEIIKDNIEYEHLISAKRLDRDRIDEILDLILETVCSKRKKILIAGDEYPAELVKAKFMKFNSSHIEFVLECMQKIPQR